MGERHLSTILIDYLIEPAAKWGSLVLALMLLIMAIVFVQIPNDPAWASANFGHNMPFILIMAAIGVVRFFSGVVELLRMLDAFVIKSGAEQ